VSALGHLLRSRKAVVASDGRKSGLRMTRTTEATPLAVANTVIARQIATGIKTETTSVETIAAEMIEMALEIDETVTTTGSAIRTVTMTDIETATGIQIGKAIEIATEKTVAEGIATEEIVRSLGAETAPRSQQRR
jgi:hypothetical protein